MSVTDILDGLNASVFGHFMRDTFWAWPFMENWHFLGLSAMFGGLLAIDLRVIGVARWIPMKAALSLIPFILGAFAIQAITGFLFFCGDPYHYTYNLSFQWKVACMALAGVNALWFWLGEHKQLMALTDGEQAPFSAKVIAAISLALWTLVIIFGRLIPYLE